MTMRGSQLASSSPWPPQLKRRVFAGFIIRSSAVNGVAIFRAGDGSPRNAPAPPCIQVTQSPNIKAGFLRYSRAHREILRPMLSAVLTLRSH